MFSSAKPQEKRNVTTILHTRLQLMWIKPVLGHFLACSLLWPCSLTETPDTELSGKREAEKARAPLSCYVTGSSSVHTPIYKNSDRDSHPPSCVCRAIEETRRFARINKQNEVYKASTSKSADTSPDSPTLFHLKDFPVTWLQCTFKLVS